MDRVTPDGIELDSAQLVLAFGATALLERNEVWRELEQHWPAARIVACSTAGEIAGTEVTDDTVVATALELSDSTCCPVSIALKDVAGSYDAGRALASKLEHEGLVHVLVLSDGLSVNGSDLVRGLVERLPKGVQVTGGLSGDGSRFERTLVSLDDPSETRSVVAIGFYGAQLRVGYGSLGGWDPFGPERIITRSRGAVLYELDGQPALELYKRYLGEHAEDLPSSGLLFPLTVRSGAGEGVVRTILAVDEETQSLTFAGDLPEGAHARLMHANFDRLVDGASSAAKTCQEVLGARSPDFALLISCVGRKLVLQQRVEEEVEAVRDVLGPGTALAGFYSYGEISPFSPLAKCELHNQTMTVTTFREADAQVAGASA